MTQIMADWITLFCVLDDYIEKMPHPETVKTYLGRLRVLLQQGGEPSSADAIECACADIHERILRVAPASVLEHFSSKVGELFDAFCVEAEVRDRGVVPDLAPYVKMRSVTVGMPVIWALGEEACRVHLSDQERIHSARVELLSSASNIIGWANDIYTCEKEIQECQVTNLVVVLAREHDLSFPEALELAVEWHDSEVKRFLELLDSLSQGDHRSTDAHLRSYGEMLSSCIGGHLDWARGTGRYKMGDVSKFTWSNYVSRI